MCAFLSVQKYGKENVKLYFNDTKWEHPDLYRFLNDIESYLEKEIVIDADGRTPEKLFIDEYFLGNNRVPLCSKKLKAERLQKYYLSGDNLIFGIGIEEEYRVQRIIGSYQKTYVKTGKYCTLEFPLVNNKISNKEVATWFESTGIKLPLLYKLGFEHNNCSGGCVRQGKKQWKHLLNTLPEVYAERERVENELSVYLGKKVTYLKDCSLKELREDYMNLPLFDNNDNDCIPECIGVCELLA
jgi:hypothetical protein